MSFLTLDRPITQAKELFAPPGIAKSCISPYLPIVTGISIMGVSPLGEVISCMSHYWFFGLMRG